MPLGAAHNVIGGPPAESTFFRASSCWVKNPIQRESGDQKGNCAPSVPDRTCASGRSSARKKRRTTPSPSRAEKTILAPLGDSAAGPALMPER